MPRTYQLTLTILLGTCVLGLLLTTFAVTVRTVHADPVIQGSSPYDGSIDSRNNKAFVPLENFEGSEKLAYAYQSGDLATFLNRLFLGAMSLGAILAVLRLAWAGFQYMASDLWANKQHAKEIIQETLLGLFLLLGISLILGQINPDILKLNVGITKLPPAQQTP